MSRSDTHQAFLKNAKGSGPAEKRIRAWLVSRKDEAVILPKTMAEKRDDWKDHVDHGDLNVRLYSFGLCTDWARAEVKGRTLKFTCRDDFPFTTLIVSSVASWERAGRKPVAYFSTNNKMDHVAIIWFSTQPWWSKKTIYDKRYDESQETYLCPLRCVQFLKMEDHYG